MRELIGIGNGVLKNESHPLTGASYYPSALEYPGKMAIPQGLTVERCFHGDLSLQAVGTLDGKGGGV